MLPSLKPRGAGLLLALAGLLCACGSLFSGPGVADCQRQGKVFRNGLCVAPSPFPPAATLTLPAWDGQLNLPGSPEAQKLDGLVTGQPMAVPAPAGNSGLP